MTLKNILVGLAIIVGLFAAVFGVREALGGDNKFLGNWDVFGPTGWLGFGAVVLAFVVFFLLYKFKR